MNIGENIKKHRKKNGLTQSQLGEISGISRNAIINYENNKRVPNLDTLKKIASSLKISIKELYPLDDYFLETSIMELINANNITIDELQNILDDNPNFVDNLIKPKIANDMPEIDDFYDSKFDDLRIFHRIKLILKTFNIDFAIRDDTTVVLVDKGDHFSNDIQFCDFKDFVYRLHWIIEREIEYFKLLQSRNSIKNTKKQIPLDELKNKNNE